MEILILGGTRFLGRHLAEAALARHHMVTLFNRGNHLSDAPAGVKSIQGDRNRDLGPLEGRRWDAVIDTCGYLPHAVKASAEFFSRSTDRYVFISSLSVYSDTSAKGIDESASVASLTGEQLEEANAIDTSGPSSAVNYGPLYSGLKAMCEHAAEAAMPNRVLSLRPGLIVGPFDYTDRFTYWVARVARGGEVLAPGRADRYVQFIDARDLAEWTVRMIEGGENGVFNATGIPGRLTMANVLDECKLACESGASITWVTEEFLSRENVAAWSEMPLWLPEGAPGFEGFMSIRSDKAMAAGLTFRSLRDTINDTLSWYKTNRGPGNLKAGMDPEREAALLRKWHEEQ